jgi:hypothetical protein
MGIRITDQPSDQHAQNPPPESDVAAGEPHSKQVVETTACSAGEAPMVMRGTHGGSGLCFVDVPAELPATVASTAKGTVQVADVTVPVLGWVRRETGAVERIGTAEEQIVRKLPPRWTIAPTGASDQAGVEGGKN